jgi:hypothetical protein
MNEVSRQLVARSVRFFSKHDEDQFFGWLGKLPCVASYRGQGIDLIVELRSDQVDDEDLRELLALFQRYGVNMAQLARFESDANRQWFKDSSAYWYSKVFETSI